MVTINTFAFLPHLNDVNVKSNLFSKVLNLIVYSSLRTWLTSSNFCHSSGFNENFKIGSLSRLFTVSQFLVEISFILWIIVSKMSGISSSEPGEGKPRVL